MKINETKAKLLRGETAFGYELALGSALVAEALARTGIDFRQVDNQHGDWGPAPTFQPHSSGTAGTTGHATPP